MAHSLRVAPEFITAYTVSEAQSPTPSPWGKSRLERPEENLTVEEIYIAPPLPRRPDYEYGRRYSGKRSRPWAPPSTPVDYYREEYHERPATDNQIDVGDSYDRVSSRERYWHQWRARSPQISESSSTCSATDCEECAFAESGRRLDGGAQRRIKPVPYATVPGNSVDPRTMAPPRMYPSAHIGQTPQLYHVYGSSRHHNAHDASESPSPTGETSLADNTALVSSSHNEMVLFDGTAWSSGPGSDEVSVMHPNVSSPRWSEIGQRYASGSESYSDDRSHSPPTSLSGLYERPDPRFIRVRPPPRGDIQRPVVIARSNDRYQSRRFEEDHGPYGDDYSDEYSGSDRRYTESEGSCSSSDCNERYSRNYKRRYW